MKSIFTDYVVGAGLATDLVNTSAEVRSVGEMLPDPAALAGFLADHDVRPEALAAGAPPTAGDLAGVHALRSRIRAVLAAGTEDAAVDGANALVARAGVGPCLRRDGSGAWQWSVATAPGASLADEMGVLTGAGLLGALRVLGHDRFRHCASPVCDGMFVDTSRAGRRRYCMPDVCGNRLNVANHRARRRATRP